MKLTLEQFETKWANSKLSVTDWFDTTYELFKELEALQSTHEAQLKAKEEEIEILKTEKLRLEEECYKYHFKINKMLKGNK